MKNFDFLSAPLWDYRAHPDNPNQQRRVTEKGHLKGMRAIQHGGPALLKRTGYMVDCYRLTPNQRLEGKIFKEKILKIEEDQVSCSYLNLHLSASQHFYLICYKLR